MLSIKLNEATKEFKISNKLAMFFLEKNNIPVKRHSSVISMEQLEMLREFAFNQEKFSDIIEAFNGIKLQKKERKKVSKQGQKDKVQDNPAKNNVETKEKPISIEKSLQEKLKEDKIEEKIVKELKQPSLNIENIDAKIEKEQKNLKVKRDFEFWDKLVQEYMTSDLTQKEFAETHSVKVSTFRYWLYKIQKKNKTNEKKADGLKKHQVKNFDNIDTKIEKKQVQSTSSSILNPNEFELPIKKIEALKIIKSLLDDAFEEYSTNIEECQDGIKDIENALTNINQTVTDLVDDAIDNVIEEKLNKTLESIDNVVEEKLYEILESRQEEAFNKAFVTIRDELTEISISTKHHEDQIESLEDKIDQIINNHTDQIKNLESKIEKINEPPPEIKKIEARIISTQKKGIQLQDGNFQCPISADEMVKTLQQHNFFLSKSVAQEIINKINNRKLIVLEGVPGTGKSRLAELLVKILLPRTSMPNFTRVSVFPEAEVWDSIGGLRMIKGYFATHLGWVSEAVMKSIEADGNHWLILDEINRGDISAFLAPILDDLSQDKKGFIEHYHLFPERENQVGKIPIPSRFRIIGTMNPFDKDLLFDFTDAFNRRIGFVQIPPLLDKDEMQFIEIMAVKRQMEENDSSMNDINKFKSSYHIEGPLKLVLQTIAKIRSLSSREPILAYRHCKLGTALALEVARLVCRLCVRNPKKAKTQIDSIADEALHDVIVSQTSGFSRKALQTIRTEVFDESWAPKSCNHLDKLLAEKYD